MENYDFNQAFDGHRLTKMLRASVYSNGNLNFTPEVARAMGIALGKELLICPMGEKDLAVVVLDEGKSERGFPIRKTGPYHYVSFKSLMREMSIDFKRDTVVYDIIELSDRYEGQPVFKFNRRIIKHECDEKQTIGDVQDMCTTDAEIPEAGGFQGEVAAPVGEDVQGVS